MRLVGLSTCTNQRFPHRRTCCHTPHGHTLSPRQGSTAAHRPPDGVLHTIPRIASPLNTPPAPTVCRPSCVARGWKALHRVASVPVYCATARRHAACSSPLGSQRCVQLSFCLYSSNSQCTTATRVYWVHSMSLTLHGFFLPMPVRTGQSNRQILMGYSRAGSPTKKASRRSQAHAAPRISGTSPRSRLPALKRARYASTASSS